eukprot:EG_transcript_16945
MKASSEAPGLFFFASAVCVCLVLCRQFRRAIIALPCAPTAQPAAPPTSCGEDYTGKVVIVTGGAKGIGRAICQLFAIRGASVWCADVDVVAGNEVIDLLRNARGTFHFRPCDVTNDAEVASAIEQVADAHGGQIDILVNNVGVQVDDGHPAHELSVDLWDKVLAINLRSHFLFAKHCLLRMLPRQAGVIINIASVQGLQSQPGIPAYAASKGGVLSLTRQLAMDYAPHGIRVLAICPGTIRTPLVEGVIRARAAGGDFDQALRAANAVYPLRRIGRPEEIAEVCLFLASERASFMTGESVVVDGGIMAKGGWCDVA